MLLVDGPLGAIERGGEGLDIGLDGADFVGASAQLGSLEIGEQLLDLGLIEVALGLGTVEFFDRNDVFLEQFDAAVEFGLGEFESLLGLLELGFEGGDFRGSQAFAKVIEGRASLRQAMLGLALGGELGLVFQREEGRGGIDGLTAGDGEGLQRASERCGGVDVLGFDVTLEEVGGSRSATGHQLEAEEKQQRGAGRAPGGVGFGGMGIRMDHTDGKWLAQRQAVLNHQKGKWRGVARGRKAKEWGIDKTLTFSFHDNN